MVSGAVAEMVEHPEVGFSHSRAMQCPNCPGFPHAARAPKALLVAVDELHRMESLTGNCADCGQSWPCNTSRLVHRA